MKKWTVKISIIDHWSYKVIVEADSLKEAVKRVEGVYPGACSCLRDDARDELDESVVDFVGCGPASDEEIKTLFNIEEYEENTIPAIMDDKNMMTDFISELYQGECVEQMGRCVHRYVGFYDRDRLLVMITEYNPKDNWLSIRLDTPDRDAILHLKEMVKTNLQEANEGLMAETITSGAEQISFRFWFNNE